LYQRDLDSLEPLAQLSSLRQIDLFNITAGHGAQVVIDLLASATQGCRLKIKKSPTAKIAEHVRSELIRARDALVAERGSRSVPVLDLGD
jgi:hypothetical protein